MNPEWNRDELWSKRDARRQRRRSWAFGVTVAGVAVGLGLANHACYELLLLGDEPNARDTFYLPAAFDECDVDEACELARTVTCCGECEPAPPFSAITRRDLADLRAACFPAERMCDPPVCSPVPPGCEARAVCRHGKCEVVANAACRR